jgi:5S rRNA maturation endonuclease (ribonuclease M5)
MVPADTGFPSNDMEMKDAILQWVESLNTYSEDSLILVEGTKDVAALKRLDIRKDALFINKGMNLFDLISSIGDGRIMDSGLPFHGTLIILTDWDRKGGMLASRLKKACLHLDVSFDLDFRRDIAILTGKWIKDVESLPSFMSHLDS